MAFGKFFWVRRRRWPRSALTAVGITVLAAGCGSGSAGASGHWGGAETLAGAGITLVSVSCPSRTFCAAVGQPTNGSGNTGYAAIYDGSSWTSPVVVDASGALTSVSCVSPSFCMATDLNGGFTTFNGSSWASPTPLPGPGFAVSVSCRSTRFCVAVGAPSSPSAAAAWVFDGKAWTGQIVGQDIYLTSVSCASEAFCVAVGGTLSNMRFSSGDAPPAQATLYDGLSWSAPQSVNHGFAFAALSCASPHFCIAGTGVPVTETGPGDVIQFDGSIWGAPVKVAYDSSPFGWISCPDSSFCMAADSGSKIVTYEGSTWSSPRSAPGSTPLSALTCASSSFCVAIDAGGQVYQWTSKILT